MAKKSKWDLRHFKTKTRVGWTLLSDTKHCRLSTNKQEKRFIRDERELDKRIKAERAKRTKILKHTLPFYVGTLPYRLRRKFCKLFNKSKLTKSNHCYNMDGMRIHL